MAVSLRLAQRFAKVAGVPLSASYQVSAVRIEHNHGDMPEHVLRHHMRTQHGFLDSPDDPDWVIDETHRGEHADAPLEHVHPDLEDEYGEDIHLGDQDWMRQVGIEPPRSQW